MVDTYKLLVRAAGESWNSKEWFSLASQFLKETAKGVNTLEENLNTKAEAGSRILDIIPYTINPRKRAYHRIEKPLKQALRCVRKAVRLHNRCKSRLEGAEASLSKEFNEAFNQIKRDFKPYEAKIIAEDSYLRGGLRREYVRLGEELGIIKSPGQEECKHKTVNLLKLDTARFREKVLEAQGDKKSLGLIPFIALLKRFHSLIETEIKRNRI